MAYRSKSWSETDFSPTEAEKFIRSCEPAAIGDLFGMILQAEGGQWNIYLFCFDRKDQNAAPIDITVLAVNWPGSSSEFAKSYLDGREVTVLGIVNGDQVFIAFKS